MHRSELPSSALTSRMADRLRQARLVQFLFFALIGCSSGGILLVLALSHHLSGRSQARFDTGPGLEPILFPSGDPLRTLKPPLTDLRYDPALGLLPQEASRFLGPTRPAPPDGRR